MSCSEVTRKLSAYLDGELSDHDASALRGHLRTCESCRGQAQLESSLVEGLRELPALDPPPALWQSVRAELAAREIADARAPWHLRLWRRAAPWRVHVGGGLAAAACAAALLWWLRPGGADVQQARQERPTPRDVTPAAMVAAPAAAEVVDVATALGEEIARSDRSYDEAVAELAKMIAEDRASWTVEYARRYDEQMVELKAQVAALPAGAARERAWQELMRAMQTALTRAELAMGVQ